jgi:hypothetical protein
VVAVPQHRAGQVPLPPFGEVHGIVLGVLARVPHVEELVHHEHAKAVAGVEQRRCRRIVGDAQRVEAGRLEDLDPAFLRAVESDALFSGTVVEGRRRGTARVAAEEQPPFVERPLPGPADPGRTILVGCRGRLVELER